MRNVVYIALAAVLSFTSTGPVAAAIVNGSFESGLTGWTATPIFVSATGSQANFSGGSPNPFLPTGGSSFAIVNAGAGDNVYATLSQSFSAQAGDTLSFSVFFNSAELLVDAIAGFNDDGYVLLTGPDSYSNLMYAQNSLTLGDFGSDGWLTISTLIPTSGSYTLEAGARDGLEAGISSNLGLDDVTLTPAAAVPEPASLVIFGLGAVCFSGFAARRRKS